MAMNVGGGSGDQPSVMATINTTPLVDVMLVLLIIFLITIPVLTKTVPVHLPHANNIPTQTKPRDITIAVDAAGNIYWNDKQVPDDNRLLALVEQAALEVPSRRCTSAATGRPITSRSGTCCTSCSAAGSSRSPSLPSRARTSSAFTENEFDGAPQ